ncbi:MAG TPA: FAD-dependent monooxygenase [Alphaproteobacteria bacterium]|nr:FAD-dependent monooxygenase [Alphaproteobacteria bacterium]
MAKKPHVIIAGAGLGGLAAALALLRAGIDVDVYEQAPALREVGAGVQVSANGTRVLYALGLGDELNRLAWQPKGKELRLWNTGEAWPMFDLGAESIERYGFPYLTFHRADLHDALGRAVRALKPDAVHLSARAVGCDQTAAGAVVHLKDAAPVQGDVLIGADGIHSVIRETLFGPDQPKFTGLIAWRGLIPRDRLPPHLHRQVGANWVCPEGHLVHYFVRRGELMNLVGMRERSDWQIESWTVPGSTEELLADFAGWHEDILTMMRNIDTPYKWALKVREPMARWSVGRITLLGDACHATLPFMAQGAVMAIEDGFILARCIQSYGDGLETALARYELARRDRTSRVIRGSANMIDHFHNSDLADPVKARTYMAAQWQPEQIRERYEWLFAYDATSVPV